MIIYVSVGKWSCQCQVSGLIYREETGSEKKEIKKEKGIEQEEWKGGIVQNSSWFKGLQVSRSNLIDFFDIFHFPLSHSPPEMRLLEIKPVQTWTTKHTHIKKKKKNPRNPTNKSLFFLFIFLRRICSPKEFSFSDCLVWVI